MKIVLSQPEESAPTFSGSPAHPGRDIVQRLAESQIFRDYQQAFEVALGLPLRLRAAAFVQAAAQPDPADDSRGVSRGVPDPACAARLSRLPGTEAALTGAVSLADFAWFNASAVPVWLGDKLIAFLETGHVLLHRPTATGFQAVVRQCIERGLPVDRAALEPAYFKAPVMSRKRYDAVLRLLGSFAQHLSMVSNELMLQQAAIEPPAVTKARAFIAEHLDEVLSLAQVARASNMSAFYFCKVFRATLGLTFTDYVARARVEKAKQILLDPRMRVSEAAYAAGFQSLSQFNRVFRRIAGEAPSGYRAHAITGTPHPRGRRALSVAA